MPGSPAAEVSPSARLTALYELRDALRPIVLAEHSEHGLQGVSGLVGQYRAALAEIELLEAEQTPTKGTPLDELASRRRRGDANTRGRSAGKSV